MGVRGPFEREAYQAMRTGSGDDVLHVVLENLYTTPHVRKWDGDVPVEAAGTNESSETQRMVSQRKLARLCVSEGTHGSRLSGKFVAAMTMMPSFCRNPSISTSSWLSVCFM